MVQMASDDDSVYTVCVSIYVCFRVVTIPRTLRPISRSYRCYLTEPTQTVFSSFPSSSLLFCLVLWQTRGPGGPWPNRWATHSRCFSLLRFHVACICWSLCALSKLKVYLCKTSTCSVFAWLKVKIRFIVTTHVYKADILNLSWLSLWIYHL